MHPTFTRPYRTIPLKQSSFLLLLTFDDVGLINKLGWFWLPQKEMNVVDYEETGRAWREHYHGLGSCSHVIYDRKGEGNEGCGRVATAL